MVVILMAVTLNIEANEKAVNLNASNSGSVNISVDKGLAGGTNDYNELINKPMINAVTLSGDKDFEDLGIEYMTNEQIDEIFKNAFRGN